MTECDEIAQSLWDKGVPLFKKLDDAYAYVNKIMEDKGPSVRANVAVGLYNLQLEKTHERDGSGN